MATKKLVEKQRSIARFFVDESAFKEDWQGFKQVKEKHGAMWGVDIIRAIKQVGIDKYTVIVNNDYKSGYATRTKFAKATDIVVYMGAEDIEYQEKPTKEAAKKPIKKAVKKEDLSEDIIDERNMPSNPLDELEEL